MKITERFGWLVSWSVGGLVGQSVGWLVVIVVCCCCLLPWSLLLLLLLLLLLFVWLFVCCFLLAVYLLISMLVLSFSFFLTVAFVVFASMKNSARWIQRNSFEDF